MTSEHDKLPGYTEVRRPAFAPPPSQLSAERDFYSQILRIKLAAPERKLEVVKEIAQQPGLTAMQRRQVLVAIQRYMLAQRSEMPANLPELLEAALGLADNYENWITVLEMFTQVLEHHRKEELVREIQPLVERHIKSRLPVRGSAVFSPDLFIRVSRRLEHNHDIDGVTKLATLALFFFPLHGPLRELRADCAMMQGDYGRARGDFDRLLELYPEETSYYMDRAEASFKLDDYQDALDDLEAYLDLNDKDQLALRRIADCHFHMGRYADALRYYGKVIEIEPAVADHYVWRGRTFEHLELYEEAQRDAAKALEIEPGSLDARQLRQGLQMRRQAFGNEDDIYGAFSRGDDEAVVGDVRIPDTHFSDIGGLAGVKQQIKETIQYPLLHPELSAKYGKAAGGGVLFFGPPGCGKTMLARAAAGECEVHFINVNLASILDKWVGNSEKAVSMIFSAARKKAPSIIFLDEVDAIGGQRSTMQSGWEKKLISQLLIELDGLTSNNTNVMVLGASNAPWDVDYALRRPGRLGRLIFVPPPVEKEREEILRLYLAKRPLAAQEIDVSKIAALTEHYSADALRQLVENAATIPWRAAIETGEERAIGSEDLLSAVALTPPDLGEWEKHVRRYEEFAKQSLAKPTMGFRRQPQQV